MGVGFVDNHKRIRGKKDGKESRAFISSHLQLLEVGVVLREVLSVLSEEGTS